MIVAVIAVGMVETPANEIVDVIAVRHRFVPAAFTVDVARLVPRGGAPATVRVAFGDLQTALVDMIAVHRVQAAIVEVVHVVAVPDGGVSAPFAMDVRVLRMDPVLGHGQTSVIHESEAEG